MTTILVTGATGFIGRSVCGVLRGQGVRVRAAVRRSGTAIDLADEEVLVGELGPQTRWEAALDGVDAVIHLAARAHILRDDSPSPEAEYLRVNRDGAEALAKEAAARGVRRFVFASTIGVLGDGRERAYSEADVPDPASPYGRSKLAAELALARIAQASTLELVIVRPSLVYGPGAPGNFRKLLDWAHRGWPLPLGGTRNARSLIYVENLAQFLAVCATHPAAAGETFVISDPDNRSTAQLIRGLATTMNRRSRLFTVAPKLVEIAARALGMRKTYDRLFGSLVVDARKARERLGWSPPIAMDEGLATTAAWYLAAGHR